MGLNTRHFSSNQHYFPILLGIYDYCYYRCTIATIATSTELVKTAEHINNLQLSSGKGHFLFFSFVIFPTIACVFLSCYVWYYILLPKLFWPTVRKNWSSDRKNKFLRLLEPFILTVKVQYNFWNRIVFEFVYRGFSYLI